jgi:hypothetical protein
VTSPASPPSASLGSTALWEEHALAAVRIKNTLGYLSALPVRLQDAATLESLLQGEPPPSATSSPADRTKKGMATVGEPPPDRACSRKRPREGGGDSDPLVGTGMVRWGTVLDDLGNRLALRPVLSQVKGQKSGLCLEPDHVPLLQVGSCLASPSHQLVHSARGGRPTRPRRPTLEE